MSSKTLPTDLSLSYSRGSRDYIRAADILAAAPLNRGETFYQCSFKSIVHNPGWWQLVGKDGHDTSNLQIGAELVLTFPSNKERWRFMVDTESEIQKQLPDIDENSIFYLMSRGLSYEQSKKLLTNGFLNEVIEKITNEEVKTLVKEFIGITE